MRPVARKTPATGKRRFWKRSQPCSRRRQAIKSPSPRSQPTSAYQKPLSIAILRVRPRYLRRSSRLLKRPYSPASIQSTRLINRSALKHKTLCCSCSLFRAQRRHRPSSARRPFESARRLDSSLASSVIRQNGDGLQTGAAGSSINGLCQTPLSPTAQTALVMQLIEGAVTRYVRSEFTQSPTEHFAEQWPIIEIGLTKADA